MSAVGIEQLAELDALQLRYIDALDTQNLSQWLETFSLEAEASYICIARENVKNCLPIAFMLDDCRARLEDRVTYINKIWVGTFQEYSTRHFVQRLNVKCLDDSTLAMRSNFMVIYTPEETGLTSVLTAGMYEDVVVKTSHGVRIRSRKAILDSAVQSRYFVYPV